MKDIFLKNVKHSTSIERLKLIKDLYDDLEEKEKIFCNHFCIHCTNGCGKCCENFVPYITELESDYLAYGLIKENKEEVVLEHLKNIKEDIICCPLYDKNNKDGHCTIYAFRPLICRLFMSSASKNKYGEPTFRNCKWNELQINISDEELKNGIEYVCSMSDFGNELESLEIENNTSEYLPIALEKSINKIRLLLELEKESQ